MNMYYVAISRARHEARIYTNAIKELPTAIARRFDKSTAMTIQRERQVQRHDFGQQGKEITARNQEIQSPQLRQGKQPIEQGRFG
jgi:ATP-dependent exoDNAse (exonuclease V) alpha subunit